MADRNRYHPRQRQRRDQQDWNVNDDYSSDYDWNEVNAYNQEHDPFSNRNFSRDNARTSGYDRTRQWRGASGQSGKYGSRSRGTNPDWRSQGGNNPGFSDWDDDLDFNEENDYDRDQNWGSPDRYEYRYPPRGNYPEPFNQRGWERRTGWSGKYPSAGMNSDYDEPANYERRERRFENLNYRRGDVGYDKEGAFYQDLDEPENYRYWQEDWRTPGQYTGRGPKNYQRSDQRIQDDVCERLTEHGQIDASNIEIEVNQGTVFLRGTVPNRSMKRMAEDVAEDITGVDDIHNEIKVQPQYQSSGYNPSSYQSRQNNREFSADYSEAGQTTSGAGLTTEGFINPQDSAAASNPEQKKRELRQGMEVIGKQGKVVGQVKEIRENDFLVDREMARDVYIPYDHIQSIGKQVLLDVLASEIDQQNWPHPGAL